MIEFLHYFGLCVLCSTIIGNYLYHPIMKTIRCFSVVITLLVFLNNTSASCDDSVLYGKLKEALLTEDNINRLRNIIYPNEGSVVTDFYLHVVTGQCESRFESYYILHVTSTSWDIKSY